MPRVYSFTKERTSVRLSVVLTGDDPPSEFRVFTAGEVDTVKGRFLFDAEAAKSVMAEYQAHGIDLMIDYDHASLGSDHAPDPSQAGKAAGWFNLEVRDGELWAVNVRWTPAAAEALRAKEWRFMSPAFAVDGERITSLLNVAVTNLPATRKLEPLMAASAKKTAAETLSAGGPMLDQDMSKKALEVIASGDAEAALAMLKDLIASAAGGGEAPASEPEMPAEMPAEMADKPVDETMSDDEDKDAVMAASSRLMRLTAKTTFAAAVDEVENWRTSHLKLEAETKKLAAERAALELGQRKENAAKLVQLGAETPHTSGLAEGKLAKRLLDEPLAEQTERVKALLAARGGKLPTTPKAPVALGAGGAPAQGDREVATRFGTVTLSAREVRICEEQGTKLEAYAENKAIHLQARGGK